MVYLLAIASAAALFGLALRVRAVGFLHAALDLTAAALLGWAAGILIGAGARIGMWAIPFFNGAESRFTFDGTVQVILVFSLYGIGLGILYELFFRRLLHGRGLLFGVFITLCTGYPLGAAGTQQLNFQPSVPTAAFFTFLFVSLMFVPFGVVLELLLARWHSRSAGFVAARSLDSLPCRNRER